MSLDRDMLVQALARHPRVARVVVAETAGSVPRETGAAMLVWPEGQSGTIGGGALEFDAVAEARKCLSAGTHRVQRIPLGPARGQCCGGAVTLVIECFDTTRLAEVAEDAPFLRRIDGADLAPLSLRRACRAARSEGKPVTTVLQDGWLLEPVTRPTRPVWIWGAGHVGRALVDVLAPLPNLALTWIDTAPDRFPETPPETVAVLPAAQPPLLVHRAPRDARHLILTYSHALDLDLCHALLTHGFHSAGLIGSATKWARFRRRLAALGHAPDDVSRITCPIGDPRLGKHPAAIAIGVAAALLADEPCAHQSRIAHEF
ncbi:xanthine dehydrogenase accessory protein XdhC [Meridianimarinicoccus sp. MJW13]|uniref:xanthine dehydrogenase accessory protein XdhC n=1 Tax=Meridianimarinicoccus sp. MJW13 TaxID=2720031 RepID=UPI00186791B4|nr:xanthine dehydrogenase accessory protein XdhC [Fluviibacterium sp. MJW13]